MERSTPGGICELCSWNAVNATFHSSHFTRACDKLRQIKVTLYDKIMILSFFTWLNSQPTSAPETLKNMPGHGGNGTSFLMKRMKFSASLVWI